MKILIITSCFAPKNVIGAVRISKIAKYLINRGNNLTIISPVLEDYDGVDNTLECDEFNSVNRITVPYSFLTTCLTRLHRSEANRQSGSTVGNQVNQSLKSRMYRLFSSIFSIWRNYEWSPKVNKIIKSSHVQYDVVISSYPNSSTHDSAWFAKRNGYAKCWVADFRDPIALDSIHGKQKTKLDRKQAVYVHRSDIVTHVSKAGVESFVCYPEDKDKVKWVPNGFDEEDFQHLNVKLEETDKCHLIFSYAGGLYSGERDCSPLFQAIRELINDGSVQKEDIIFEYAGRDFGILKSQAEKFQLDCIIHDKGMISRVESIEMQASSDCVVVATFCYTDHGGAMTGKIYEPIMMKRPILLLVNGTGQDSEPGTFVEYLNAGTVYEESRYYGDVTVIKEMILKMLTEKKENGLVASHIDDRKREEYNYKNIVRTMSNEIERIVNGIK